MNRTVKTIELQDYDGQHCPLCKGELINDYQEYNSPDLDEIVYCNVCNSEFREIYKLIEVRILKADAFYIESDEK